MFFSGKEHDNLLSMVRRVGVLLGEVPRLIKYRVVECCLGGASQWVLANW